MISKIQNLGSHLLSTDIKAKMIDDDLYYIFLDEVQLVPRFEALPKISENTQIFLKTSVICEIPHKKAPDASRTRGLRVYLIFMKYNQLLVAHHSNIL